MLVHYTTHLLSGVLGCSVGATSARVLLTARRIEKGVVLTLSDAMNNLVMGSEREYEGC